MHALTVSIIVGLAGLWALGQVQGAKAGYKVRQYEATQRRLKRLSKRQSIEMARRYPPFI